MGILGSWFGNSKPSGPAPETLDLNTGIMSRDTFNDYSRRYIAYALLVIVSIIVIIALFDLCAINGEHIDSIQTKDIWAADAKADADRLVAVLNVIFGPIVTLLGTATGFYFGTKGNDAQANRTAAPPPLAGPAPVPPPEPAPQAASPPAPSSVPPLAPPPLEAPAP